VGDIMERNMEFIFDSAAKLLKAATDNEDSINKLVQNANKNNASVKQIVDELKSIQEAVDYTISNSLNRNSSLIADKITEEVLQEFKEANEWAIKASETYQKAVKYSFVKIILIPFVFFILVSSSLVLYYEYFLPERIESLVKMEKELEKNIEELEKKGGLIKLYKCDGIPCVKISGKSTYIEKSTGLSLYFIQQEDIN